ncbi:type II secretion system F family protein [Arthrobacter yangruifuii]|uniref:Type II secretion system F family protein n=1 Tax=Arthrobacter yangruifuii TaxID=2606616 RepID=A0A5N6MVJ7_9MICC|nr:type II secretion system F family protein [Arthrobacter yangruifuii]KAD4060148.1 type II secretion system F family protein [Arthrobacter yangruifuii]
MSGLVVFACLAAAAVFLLAADRQPMPADGGAASASAGHASVSDPALMLDLTAAMLEAGQSLPSALAILAEGADPATARELLRLVSALDLGLPWDTAWQLAAGMPEGQAPYPTVRATGDAFPAALPGSALADLGPALRFTARTGAPSAAVLYSHADSLRRRRQTEARRRAAALGVRLVMPLGLCSLPAFVALTVVPLLMSLLPGRA